MTEPEPVTELDDYRNRRGIRRLAAYTLFLLGAVSILARVDQLSRDAEWIIRKAHHLLGPKEEG